MKESIAAVAALAAIVVGGCGHENMTPPKSAEAVPVAPQQQPPTLTSAAVQSKDGTRDLGLSDDILKACQIHIGNIDDAPKFDFDRAELASQDRDVLNQVATCVTTGPLKGQKLELVGRADPRGETEYNLVLGSSRASSVGSYLKGLGVEGSKVNETSRGELDATGTDEATWAKDRRVDIRLAR
jgi:peptidoglycan-associated lipoprotein